MKHVVYAEKSLLMSDEGANALIEYARVLAELSQTDTVTVPAIDVDGNAVEATVLLTPATHIVVETGTAALPAPDASGAVAYMRVQAQRRLHPPAVQPEEEEEIPHIRYDDLG